MKLLVLLAAGTTLVAGTLPRPAPPIAGPSPITGKRVSLAQFRGKAVVINVWASWCPGCRQEAADLVRFAKQHPNVQLLGVDYDDAPAAARAAYRRWKWTWPVVADPKGKWRTALKSPGLPTTVFLNRKHEIVGGIVGAGTLEQFNSVLREALKG